MSDFMKIGSANRCQQKIFHTHTHTHTHTFYYLICKVILTLLKYLMNKYLSLCFTF